MSCARLLLAVLSLAASAAAASERFAALSPGLGRILVARAAATADTPDLCRIVGTLRPTAGSRIGFELHLPALQGWTGRFQMLGNGGYSSKLPREAMASAPAWDAPGAWFYPRLSVFRSGDPVLAGSPACIAPSAS